MKRETFNIIFVSIISLLLGSCSLFSQKDKYITLPSKTDIHLNASYQVNQNSPIHVFVVLIYDKKLYSKLKGLTAKAWNMNYKQFVNDNPTGLIIKNWELIPGQQVFYTLKPADRRNISGILAFADYQAPGSHRKSVLAFSKLTVNLNNKKFNVHIAE